MKNILYWLPRLIALLYILFIGLFASDVFSVESSVPLLYILVAFFIHLIPSFVLLILLLIAWRYEKTGGILFIVAASLMVIIFDNTFPTNIILFGPPLAIGILFLMSAHYNKPHKST